MNCSTSLALAKLWFVPFHVNCRDPGCASVYLMLSRCSDLFTDVKVFSFLCKLLCHVSKHGQSHAFPFDPTVFSGRSHYFISCRLSHESDQHWSGRLSVIGHGSERDFKFSANFNPESLAQNSIYSTLHSAVCFEGFFKPHQSHIMSLTVSFKHLHAVPHSVHLFLIVLSVAH